MFIVVEQIGCVNKGGSTIKDINKNIISRAKDTLKKHLNYAVEFKIKSASELEIKIKSKTDHYYFEIYNNISQAVKSLILYRKTDQREKYLVISEYINSSLAEELRTNNINFIDTSGNAFIDHPECYIFIKGNKDIRGSKKNKIYKNMNISDLKLIFTLFIDDKILNSNYRIISKTANISLGSVGRIIEKLKILGYLADMGSKGMKLVNKQSLFEKWCVEFSEKLKPKMLLGVYRGKNDWWKNYDQTTDNAMWSGEVAAYKLKKYLKPENVILYAGEKQLNNILIKNRLIRDKNGNLEVYDDSWMPAGLFADSLGHLILIYSDLVYSGNQRNIEAARMIYEENIKEYLR